MCLKLGKATKYSWTTSRGIRKTKDGKFLVGYKVLRVDNNATKGSFVSFDSPYKVFQWKLYPESKDNLVVESNRENTTLSGTEINEGVIYLGFHFFTSIKGAKKEQEFLRGISTSEDGDITIVECHIPIESFVAQGGFINSKSFVSTQAKLVRIVKEK